MFNNVESAITTQVISIDLGNGMIKGARKGTMGEIIKECMPNKVEFGDTLDTENSTKIELNNKTVYVGIGELNDNQLKHDRPHLMEQSLAMICKLYPSATKLKAQLRLGLPATHCFNEQFRNKLKAQITTGEWVKFKCDGVDRSIFIESVGVCVEGYSAYMSIRDRIDVDEDILIIDVGAGTTDLCSFIYENGVYRVGKVHTIDVGVNKLTEIIANAMSKSIGTDVKATKVDERLRSGKNTILYNGENHNILDYLDVIEPTVKSMLNEMNKEYNDIGKFYSIGIGGGYATFNRVADKYIKATVDFDDNTRMYANAEGYLKQ